MWGLGWLGQLLSMLRKIKDGMSPAAGRVRGTSKKVADDASLAMWRGGLAGLEAVDATQKAVGATSSVITEGSRIGSRRVKDAASSAADSAQDASKKARDATISIANGLLTATQGVLAVNLSNDVNALLQKMVAGSATIYDKAMDAEYLANHVGGSYHRLFDGGHTITGAFSAAHGASSEDNIVQEAMGTLQGLLRDVSTPRGLPLANWDKATFDQVAGTLESNFHIPKDWFYDLNTYDAAELLNSTIGVVALAFSWNRADTESFARLVGSMGVSAAISANPLLLIATVVALARAFQKARQTGEYAEFVDGQLRGGVSSGATLAAISLVGVAGGPASAALLVGLTTGILVNKATENVSVVEIGQFAAAQTAAAANEAKTEVTRIAELYGMERAVSALA